MNFGDEAVEQVSMLGKMGSNFILKNFAIGNQAPPPPMGL